MTELLQGIDPKTGRPVGEPLAPTTTEELDRILAAAAAAAPTLVALPATTRQTALNLAADRLDAAVEELVPLADAETGLGDARLRGEVARTTGQLRLLGQVAASGAFADPTIDHGNPAASPPQADLRRIGRAVGPVLVFAASNFPFAFSVAGGDTASALASGCSVIVKTHPGHPTVSVRVAELVAEALHDAGLPDGTFAVVHGVSAGTNALQDPRVRAAAFTGSVAGGRALFDLAARRPDPIPFFGELGSINPVVITPRAVAERRDAIADGLVASFTQGVGQFCTKPGLVFVPAGSGFTEAVTQRVGAAAAGAMLGPRLRDAFGRGRDALSAAPGVRELATGASAPDDGAWAQPVVYGADVATFRADPERLLTECFGPATVLVEWADTGELRAALAALEGSLTATIQAADDDDEDLLATVLPALTEQAGRVIWNGWPTGVAVTWAMQHGGPYPSSTAAQTTSVGSASVARFLRPVCYQDVPDRLLPPELQDANPFGLVRRVDGIVTLPQ